MPNRDLRAEPSYPAQRICASSFCRKTSAGVLYPRHLRDVVLRRSQRSFRGLVANIFAGRNYPLNARILSFVNLLKSEDARKQFILVVDGPVAGKAETLPQPQHGLETRDRSPCAVK